MPKLKFNFKNFCVAIILLYTFIMIIADYSKAS